MYNSKKAQVWIETVLYTLIGLALIGMALGFIMPKINESKDRIMVEQAINSLSVLDDKINEVVQGGNGNRREYDFSMKRGELWINASENKIIMILGGLTKPYSEPNAEVKMGRVNETTVQTQKAYSVILKMEYYSNITYKGTDNDKKFTQASIPYRFKIENFNGIIDIEEISG